MNQSTQLVCPSCHERLRLRDPMLFREPQVLCPGCGVALGLSRNENGTVNVAVVARPVHSPASVKPKTTTVSPSAPSADASPAVPNASRPAAKTSPPDAGFPARTGSIRRSAARRGQPAVSRLAGAFRWLTQYPTLTAIAATGVFVTGLVVVIVLWGPQSTGSARDGTVDGKLPAGASANPAGDNIPAAARPDAGNQPGVDGLVKSDGTAATASGKKESTTVIGSNRVAAAMDAIEEKLLGIGRTLFDDTDGPVDQLPTAVIGPDRLPAEESLSWLATLADDLSPQRVGAPQRELGWRDPANEGFVRRRIESLLNPNVLQLASEDRYPATHFVGITGYGPAAADLPASHPRAGAFRNRGGTRWGDFRDGRSNTMIVAGVSKNIGPWAAGGTATARAFTKSPFVNGPDGFGVGRDGNVPVLMADGSVRHLAPQIDDAVVRSLVCLANDDSPLDEPSADENDLPLKGKSKEKSGEQIADKSQSSAGERLANAGLATNAVAGGNAELGAMQPAATDSTDTARDQVAGKTGPGPDVPADGSGDDAMEAEVGSDIDRDRSDKTGDEKSDGVAPNAIADDTNPTDTDGPDTDASESDKTDGEKTDGEDEDKTDEPEIVQIDIPAAMAVKLARFEENGNATLDKALLQFSDLVGVPVQLTPDAELAILELRQKPVRASLKNVTVAEALSKILEPFGLIYEIGEQRVQVVPRPATDKSNRK